MTFPLRILIGSASLFFLTNARGDFSSPYYDQLDDTAPASCVENEFCPGRITSSRGKHINLRDSSGNELGTTTNPIQAALPARTSTANSSSTPLGSSATFTGACEDVFGVSTITIGVKADQDSAGSISAPAGLIVTFASDSSCTNVIDTDSYFITANKGKQYSLGATTRYLKVSYVNGSVAQGSFNLQTNYHYIPVKPSSHRLGDNVSPDDDAELGKVGIVGQAPDGTIKNVAVDEFGNLLVSAITGSNAAFSFGDVTTAATTKTVVRRTTYTEQTADAQRSVVSSSANDSSAGTGCRTWKLYYCTAAFACGLTDTITLNGVTPVNTNVSNITYVEKMECATVGSTGSNVGTITLKAATAGGGATIGTVAPTELQSFWGHHYVPTGKTCSITGVSASHSGTTVGSGGVFVLTSDPLASSVASELQVSDFVRLYGQSSSFLRSYVSPIKVIGPARVTLYVTPETSSSTVYRGGFDFFEQ